MPSANMLSMEKPDIGRGMLLVSTFPISNAVADSQLCKLSPYAILTFGFIKYQAECHGRRKRLQVELTKGTANITLILRRSRTGTVWFYTSTSNKRAAPKLYTKSLTRDLKLMYSRLTLVRISINL